MVSRKPETTTGSTSLGVSGGVSGGGAWRAIGGEDEAGSSAASRRT
jgi:hypothetical protein